MQSKMTAAWLRGLRRFEIVEVEIPRIEPDQVLVKVSKVGICGSDLGMWQGKHFFNDLYDWDHFTPGEHGHEASGVVVQVGKEVKGVKEGDLACRLNLTGSHDLMMACFAEYAVADAPIVVNGADPEVVCFADPVSVALNHIHHAQVSPGDTVLVMGQGFLGLLVTQLLRHQHINVVATDLSPKRLALAEKFGARAVDASSGTGFQPASQEGCLPHYEEQITDLAPTIHAVIECSGAEEPLEVACRLLARGGTIVIMGAYRTRITLNYTQLRIRGAQVKFPMNCVNCEDNWPTAAEILHRGEIEVKSLIGKRDKLVNLQTLLENYDNDWLRVVLEP